MIPDESLSLVNLPTSYVYPDNLIATKTLDYELGGVALNNPEFGLQTDVWQLRLVIDDVSNVGTFYLGIVGETETEMFNGLGITEGSLAFDQNMNPFIAYVQAGEGKYWWFDTVAGTMVHSTLPVGSGPPKCSLDDKRSLQGDLGASDIIMCYIRSGTLYFRAQRDRYTVEYPLETGLTGQVLKVGMNYNWRLQISVGVFE